MPRVLIAYMTRHGSTEEVARAVARTLGQHGLSVELRLDAPLAGAVPSPVLSAVAKRPT